MRYGPDFDNATLFVISILLIVITVAALWRMQALDENAAIGNGKSFPVVGGMCICGGNASVVLYVCKMWWDTEQSEAVIVGSLIAMSILAGCLLTACIMDVESCMVYNYIWWVGGLAGTVILCMNYCIGIGQFVIFALLQELLFSRMYGRADCHAFVVCALVHTAIGMTMQEYLLHMLLAVALLALHQAWRRNIGRRGRLKQSVPFLPYIVISFWLMLLLNLS